MECYICCDKETKSNPFCNYQPCKCKGTNKVHENCLEKLKINCGNKCTICKSNFVENNFNKPLLNKNYNTYPAIQCKYLLQDSYEDDLKILEYFKQVSTYEEYVRRKELTKVKKVKEKECCNIS